MGKILRVWRERVAGAILRRWHGASWLRRSSRLLIVLMLSGLSYFVCSHFVLTVVEVRGQSMAPTLRSGDRFLLNCAGQWFHQPQRGDLVVFGNQDNKEFSIKRVVGLPGETVQMRKNIIYINGDRLFEPYLPPSATATEEAMMERPIQVPPDTFFLLGDNRSNSEDSRCFGPVPAARIRGALSLGPQPRARLRSPEGRLVDEGRGMLWPGIAATAKEKTAGSIQRP